MVLVQEKKGGPYTKFDREARQKEVFRLHIEQGYPATKIADMMKVHRNTINDDLKTCYSHLGSYFKDRSLYELIIKQLHRLEIQRTRLLEHLNDDISLKEKLIIERFVYEIDNRIYQFFSDARLTSMIL